MVGALVHSKTLDDICCLLRQGVDCRHDVTPRNAGVSAESAAWQWAASLDNLTQQAALSRVIQAVHDKGGYWFQQLFHVGRSMTPALVKLARERAGLRSPPPYGYRPVSASAVAESGLNTHSGEHSDLPHSLTIEEIHCIRDDFKKAAQLAVEAGADGIEVRPFCCIAVFW